MKIGTIFIMNMKNPWQKNRIMPESFVNIEDLFVGIPNNFNIVSNKDALYVLPTESKPIKVKFKEEN